MRVCVCVCVYVCMEYNERKILLTRLYMRLGGALHFQSFITQRYFMHRRFLYEMIDLLLQKKFAVSMAGIDGCGAHLVHLPLGNCVTHIIIGQ